MSKRFEESKGSYRKRPGTTPEEEARAWEEVLKVLLEMRRKRAIPSSGKSR